MLRTLKRRQTASQQMYKGAVLHGNADTVKHPSIVTAAFANKPLALTVMASSVNEFHHQETFSSVCSPSVSTEVWRFLFPSPEVGQFQRVSLTRTDKTGASLILIIPPTHTHTGVLVSD